MSYGPNYEYWKKFATLAAWEIASMMKGFDPRSMPDITDRHGDGLDLSDEIRMLASAAMTSELVTIPNDKNAQDREKLIAVSSLIPWLRGHGYCKQAEGLTAIGKADSKAATELPDAQRRLGRLKELGGGAFRDRDGNWRFKGISELINAEASENRPRSSDKIVRADLKKAVEIEVRAEAEGIHPGNRNGFWRA